MLRWWRQRRYNGGAEPSSVAVDVHCHLLPAVDDGVDDDDEALTCLHELATMGYRGSVLTPHIYPEVYDNDEDELRQQFEAFTRRVRDDLPEGFALRLGAEYMLDEMLLERLYEHPERLLTFGPEGRWLLVELPTIAAPPALEQFVDECLRRELTPLLAHAERYPYMHEHQMRGLVDWRGAGGLVQLNIGSLATNRNRAMRDAAREIARQSLVDLIGTDLHGPPQIAACREGWRATGRWLRGIDVTLQRSVLNTAEAR